MLGASSFLMVSALIIQSLFSRRAFWEFPLMEGQIDSYEIVITAFLGNERAHQIAKEDRVIRLIRLYLPSGHERGEERTVQSDSVRLPNKLVCHLSPLWSCFLFLSASCLGGDWWGPWRSWVACQSCRALIPLSGLPVQAQIPPP